MDRLSFSWKALDKAGKIIKGTWEVNQGAEVRRRLFAKGYFPLSIVPRRRRFKGFITFLVIQNKKSDYLRIWAGILQKLSLLLSSGISLLLAIRILKDQNKGGLITRLGWERVQEELEEGLEFSQALKSLILPPNSYLIAIIQAGEQAGRLPETMENLSRELMEEHNYRRKLRGALAYPLLLLGLTICVLYALSLWVLPVYLQIFSSMTTELPLLTRVIFQVSEIFPMLLMFLILIGLGAFLFLRLSNPEFWREKLRDGLSRIPLFGKVYRLNEYLLFSQTLGTLLEAGIPLLEAFKLTRETVLTFTMKGLVQELEEAARAGRELAPILCSSEYFPRDGAQILEVGEESGQFVEMLLHLSRIFRMELEEQMDNIPHLIGPFLIVILAGIIGLVAVGVLLPIFDIGTHLQ